VKWVCENVYDVEADLLRFYGMTLEEATESMSGARFFELTMRLFRYDGAMAALAAEEQPEKDERQEVPLGDPSLAGIVEY